MIMENLPKSLYVKHSDNVELNTIYTISCIEIFFTHNAFDKKNS